MLNPNPTKFPHVVKDLKESNDFLCGLQSLFGQEGSFALRATAAAIAEDSAKEEKDRRKATTVAANCKPFFVEGVQTL